jgi:hypothetical protein
MSIHIHQNMSPRRSGIASEHPAESQQQLMLRTVGIVEIAGGLLGVGAVAALMLQQITPESIIAGGLYVLSVIAGALLCQERPAGYWLSLAMQLIQIPWIVTSGAVYAFASGLALHAGYGAGGVSVDYSLSSMFYFAGTGWGPASVHLVNGLGINLIPLIAMVILFVCQDHVRRHFTNSRRRR